MKSKNLNWNVPFFRKNINVYLQVDKIFLTLILVSLFSITYTNAQNQKELDSLTNIYNNLKNKKDKIKLSHKLFKLTIHHDKALALIYAKEQLELSKEIKYIKGEGTAYRDIAYYYRFLPKPDSARHYFKKSVKTFKDNGNRERLCTALDRFATFEIVQGNFETALKLVDQNIAISTDLKNGKILVDNLQRKSVIYLDLGDFASAMEVVLKSIVIADTIKPKYLKGKAVGLSDIGRIEIHRNKSKAALEPTKKALQLFKELNETKWQAIVLNQLGNAYWNLENYDEALNTYKQSLDIVTAINRKDYMATALSNMAGIYSKKGDYNKAIKMIEDAHKITLKIGTASNIVNNYGMIGDIHLEHNKTQKAIYNYSKAIQIGDSLNTLDDLYSMYESRSNAYQKQGDYKSALADYKEHKILYDSIFSTKSEKHIEELKTKYQTQKSENEILLLEAQKKKDYTKRLILIILLIASILLGALTIYSLSQKMKRNKIENEKLDASLQFKEKELTTHALHLAHKNEILLDLKSQLKELKSSSSDARQYQSIINNINLDINNDNNWEQFRNYFEDVHKDFNSNVKRAFPDVSSNDLRLMSLLKMNLSSKEIANILNISPEGVKKARYRLRKKLNLSTKESLQELVIEL